MNRLEAIEARLAAIPELRPYVTSKGGVVVLNGPFAMPKADAAREFIASAPADLRLLLAVAQEVATYRAHGSEWRLGLRDDEPRIRAVYVALDALMEDSDD